MSSTHTAAQPGARTADPVRLTIELTNICNLHCSYCMRDEDALYAQKANYFPADLLTHIIRAARDTYDIDYVTFTGGEVTLHPRFNEIAAAVAAEGIQFSFVTNGWHFDRVYPALLAHKQAVRLVAFSVDGATREAHDHWRGAGSFDRVIRAVTRCHVAGIPFVFKVGIRRDTLSQLEQIALLAARLGAVALHFAHLLPTSAALEAESALTLEEQRHAEQEVGVLSRIMKMPIGIAVGYYDIDPGVPCSPLKGTSCNVDWRGRLTLCCNMAGYRNADAEPDVVADLTREDFATGYARLKAVAAAQVERRARALAALAAQGIEPDLYTGSPCLFCLQSFGKIPWRTEAAPVRAETGGRALPVLPATPLAPAQNWKLDIV
jgi:MoaA/NifB/PqqE/SkfB family radical SAM enzyme